MAIYNPPRDPDLLRAYLHATKENTKAVERLIALRRPSPWITPTLINNYKAPPAPYKTVQYRLSGTKDLDFRGHIEVSLATTNTVAFVLPRIYWRDQDYSFATDVYSGGTMTVARVYINSTNGEVSLIFS